MSSVPSVSGNRFFFRLNAVEVCDVRRDLATALEHLRCQTGVAGAVIYTAGEEPGEFRAIAARAPATPRIPELGVTLTAEATQQLRRLAEPLDTDSAGGEHFANLPEILQYGFRRVLLLPLRAGDALLGFLTIGRTENREFEAGEIAFAAAGASLISAVLERDVLLKTLRERKLVERAKGIVQQKRRLSEEQAYLMLRNQSRRARRSLADVAQEIIEAETLRKIA